MLEVSREHHVAGEGIFAGDLGGSAVQTRYGHGAPVGFRIVVDAGVEACIAVPYSAYNAADIAVGDALVGRGAVVHSKLMVEYAVGIHLRDHFKGVLGRRCKRAVYYLTLVVGVVDPEVGLGEGTEYVEQAVHLIHAAPQILGEGETHGIVFTVAIGILGGKRGQYGQQIVPVLRLFQTQLVQPVGAQPQHGHRLAARGVKYRYGKHIALVGDLFNGGGSANALYDLPHAGAGILIINLIKTAAYESGVCQELELRLVNAQHIRYIAGGYHGVDLVCRVGGGERKVQVYAKFLGISAAPDVVLVRIPFREVERQIDAHANVDIDRLVVGGNVAVAILAEVAQIVGQVRLGRKSGTASEQKHRYQGPYKDTLHTIASFFSAGISDTDIILQKKSHSTYLIIYIHVVSLTCFSRQPPYRSRYSLGVMPISLLKK